MRWMHPREHSEETPVGALFLHWIFTVFMIIVTVQLTPLDAYGFLVGIYSYAVVSAFNFLVATTREFDSPLTLLRGAGDAALRSPPARASRVRRHR